MAEVSPHHDHHGEHQSHAHPHQDGHGGGHDGDADAKPGCCENSMLAATSSVDAPKAGQIGSILIHPILLADLADSAINLEAPSHAFRAPPPSIGGILSSFLSGPRCLPNGPPHLP